MCSCSAVLCRAEAKSLYALKPELDKLGVRLVCVVHESLPAEIKAFWPEYWYVRGELFVLMWFGVLFSRKIVLIDCVPCRPGELYLDTDKQLYKALGNGKLRKGSLLWFLNPFSVIWQHAREAKEVHNIQDSNLKVPLPGTFTSSQVS